MPSWATVVARHRWRIIVGAVLFMAIAGALGANVAEHLRSGGYVDQESSSARADRELAERFGAGSPNLVLLADAGDSVDTDTARAAGVELTARLRAEPHVEYVRSYWDTEGNPELRNERGDKALLLVRLSGDETEAKERAEALRPRFATDTGPLTVTVGGQAQVDNEVDDQSAEDLLLAEVLIAPITLLILLWVFRSVIAALLPLLVAGFAVVGTQFVLLLLTNVTDVSIFALNVATGLGLGLAIDYSLLVVSRFREALQQSNDVDRALAVTISTAGRTIIFSSITVICSLAGLMAFNTFFLRSLGYAGIAVTALCGAAAIIALPAVLAALGHRVNKWRVPSLRRRRSGAEPASGGFWQAWVTRVMRRPGWYAAGALVLILFLAAPVLSINFSLADDRALPRDAPASQVSQAIRDEFPVQQVNSLTVVAHGEDGAAPELVSRYATALSQLPGVTRVDGLTGSYAEGAQVGPATAESPRFAAQVGDGSYLTALVEPDPLTPASRDLVADVRALDAPFATDVSGAGAVFADTLAGQRNGLPWALGIMVLATLIMLTWMTGSFVVPVKAVLLNILSLAAAFGIVVWVFQEGHLRWLVGDFQVTGFVVSNMPLLLLCVAFGLSMDYEVFLLSRIKEEYDASGDNRRAVAVGIARTGRIVTAAALLMTVVFLSFVTSGVVYLKLIGLGTAMAILIDAVLIRAVLLPALMILMGRANWWAPRAVQRLVGSTGLRERELAGAGRDQP
ncbi:MAG: MMPL family transporter [Micromonosporaceae bacterium]|nr:MMPL family transporter [Micromonosporaceae bacterium]